MRLDLAHIQRWIAPGSRVLDLGCGDGEFLRFADDQRQVRGTGLEIDEDNITAAVSRGLNIVAAEHGQGPGQFPRPEFRHCSDGPCLAGSALPRPGAR